MPQRGFSGVPRVANFLLGTLAFGDLFGGHIDRDDLAACCTQRMPISHPEAFNELVRALTGHLYSDDRFAAFHDRADDLLDGVRELGHAVPHETPEMIFDRYAADLGQTLVDLQVATVRRQAGKPDRRRVVDQL